VVVRVPVPLALMVKGNGGVAAPLADGSAIGTTAADLIAIGVRLIVVTTLSDGVPSPHCLSGAAGILGAPEQRLIAHALGTCLPSGEISGGGVSGDHGPVV